MNMNKMIFYSAESVQESFSIMVRAYYNAVIGT